MRITTPKYANHAVDISLSVVSGVVEKVAIPASLRMDWVGIENKVLLVQSDEEIIVYGLNKEKFSTDGFLVYPTDVIGYEYFTLSHSPTNSYTEFAIGAKYDHTNVLVQLPSRRNAIPIRVELNNRVYTSGDSFNITLQSFQSFQCLSLDLADLTATHITSDKPIAVFSGNARTWVGESNSRDHLAIQLPPIQAYGKHFPIIPIPGRTVGDFVRIVASKPMTTITVIRADTDQPITYEIGTVSHYEDFIVPSDSYTTITSDKPVLVAQISQSQKELSEPGDPTMLVVTSTEQFTADYVFSTPSYTETGKTSSQSYKRNIWVIFVKM